MKTSSTPKMDGKMDDPDLDLDTVDDFPQYIKGAIEVMRDEMDRRFFAIDKLHWTFYVGMMFDP